MPEFTYTAADRSGRTFRGRITAEGLGDAGTQLDRQGLIPLRVAPKRSLSDLRPRAWRDVHWRLEDKILFTQKLASLLKSGIPILTVLDLIARQTANLRVATALRQIGDQVAGGQTLSAAMATASGLFDSVYLGAIQTGESTGRLDTVLEQTAAFLEREMITRRKIKETVRYPIMVVIAMVVVGAFVVKFVVPKFLSFYTHYGGSLPAPTRLLMAITAAVDHYWWVGPPLVAAIWVWWWRWTRTTSGRRWRDRMLLRLPLAGTLFLKVAVSRFARLFGVLYSAGVPVTTALDTVAAGIGNEIAADDVVAMRQRLTVGEPAAAAAPDAVMPSLVYQMIGIGFESGEIERMMAEVARHYEQEIDYDVRRLTDRVQPILIFVLAGGVLLLALAVVLPMWNLYTLFRQ
ncbi:MAG: type II secretion system F family protein [Candidatus Zixiibacteriota bacterium]